jgi:hypothetical protein
VCGYVFQSLCGHIQAVQIHESQNCNSLCDLTPVVIRRVKVPEVKRAKSVTPMICPLMNLNT